jgi:hypothetical protein
MTRIAFAAAALTTALLADSGVALAQRYTQYPVCAIYGFRTQSCAFHTMQQCYMSISGRGGWCEANPLYQPPGRGKRSAKRSS